MKIALCISGYLRTFKECYPSILKNLIQDNDVDVFIHTYDKMRAQPCYHNYDEYDRESNYDIDIDFMGKIPNLKVLVLENWDEIKYKFWNFQNTLKINYTPVVYAAPYKIYKCNELKKQYEKENNFIYDLVIRTRGDQIFTKKINFDFPKEKILINSYPFGDEDSVHKCKSQSNTYLNDRFAVGTSENIDILSDLYNHLGDFLGGEGIASPIERMFALHLENHKIELERRNLGFYVKHSPTKNSCRLCGEPLKIN